MRDPMSWAIPLPVRPFGITVKIHFLFFAVTLAMFLRKVAQKDNPVWWVDAFCLTILLLFFVILLHEYGHCFGCRAVGGEATEILLWPLGGLAFVEPPHNPRAHLITVAAGPTVNLVLCIACGLVMIACGFWPNANPVANPYTAEMRNIATGRTYTSVYGLKLYKPGTLNEPILTPIEIFQKVFREREDWWTRDRYVLSPENAEQMAVQMTSAPGGAERALAPPWLVWVQRAFQINWVLFLFNMMLPAFPLDCGQLLQGTIWARTGSYRQGTVVACYSGFVVSMLMLIVALYWNETLMLLLSIFIFVTCTQKLHSLDQEEGVFGYDFSQGYTSLERDEPPPPQPKKIGPLKRWLQARQARRIAREQEERARDEERMDELLAKIARQGKEALTDEERRFMERVSARYRNRS
jgi:Zn-dependent protease